MVYEITKWIFFCLYLSYFCLYLFVQTLTILQLRDNPIGAKGAQYFGDALQNKAVNISLSLFISICTYSRRSWPHSNWAPVRLQTKEFNIWLMVYEIIRWTLPFLHFLHIHPHFFKHQTLATLDLGDNKFGEEGFQHLFDALRNNTVNFFSLFSFLS